MSLARIKIVDDEHGRADCPCETTGELVLPEPGHIPDSWPVRSCCRCAAWIIDIHEELVCAAVEGLQRAYPGSIVGPS